MNQKDYVELHRLLTILKYELEMERVRTDNRIRTDNRKYYEYIYY
jgi:hypothetical protein